MSQVQLTKESAAKILNSRKLITAPGKYQVQVTAVTPFERDGQLTSIVNLAAMNDYQLGVAREAFKAGNYQEATNTQLSASQRIGKDYIPAKGEIVNITVDNVALKDGGEGLLITSLTEVPVTKATNVNFSFDDEPEMVLAEEEQAAGKIA